MKYRQPAPRRESKASSPETVGGACPSLCGRSTGTGHVYDVAVVAEVAETAPAMSEKSCPQMSPQFAPVRASLGGFGPWRHGGRSETRTRDLLRVMQGD